MLSKILKTSCIAAGMFAITAAHATTNVKMDLADAAKAATAIVTGEVLSSVTVMNGRTPETRITLDVGEQLKGSTSQTITVVMPGGNYKQGKFRVGETVPGIAPVLASEESVYFLSSLAEANEYQIVGFNQGQLSMTNVDGEMMISGRLTRGAQYSLSEMRKKLNEVEGL